ncbi:MAG TPA: BatA domain-containing protein, partial [Steroidobacteraceae bacterium]|nr:BatA domain-containing protein [Steroidobacteraceae bacterium]
MTFLNPYALFALIAASFPVLFHLFAQRRARRIEFSSIRFLKQLEKSSMRKVKLRQILLLILRTLLIACLVLAFARPALRGYLGGFFGSSHANTTAIVLFDNSASMTRADASGTYFKQAQDAAMKIADALEGGDEFVLIPLAHLERGKVYRRLHDPAEIRKAINELSVSDAPAKLADGLRIASSELAKTANVNREVYLISDNQARNLTGITSADSAMKLFDERTNVFSAKIGASTSLRNLTIDSIVSVSTVFESGRPLEFDVFIRNSGDVQIDNAIVSLFYNDERVAQRSVAALASGHSEKCTINALPKSAGILNVKAELEDDALAFDNARYLTLELPATSRVAIFTNTNADADFIRLALEQSLSDASIKPYSIELHRTEELRMLPSLRERVNAVMVELGGALEPEDAKALHDYVASGRGAAIFPLAGLDPAQFNSSIGSALSLPQLQSLEGSLASGEKYSGFGAFDLAHPFFTGMFDQNSNPNTPGIESPKIFEYYKFAATSLPLIKLTSGAAYLSDITAGKGHILLYSVPPTFSFSDLPRKPIFLPLVRRTAAYLASMKNNEES